MKYIFSLFLSLSVFFCFMVLMVYQNMNSILFSEENKTKIAVYFKSDLDMDQIDSAIKSIIENTGSIATQKVSQAQQIEDFKAAFSAEVLSQINENELMDLLPYSVEFKYANQGQVVAAESYAKSLSEVESVSKSFVWNEKLKLLGQLFSGSGQGLFLFVFLATALMTVALVRTLVINQQQSMTVRAYLGEKYIRLFKEPLIQILSLLGISFLVGLGISQLFYFIFKIKILQNSEFAFLLDRVHLLNVKYVIILAIGLLCSCLLGVVMSAYLMRKSIYETE